MTRTDRGDLTALLRSVLDGDQPGPEQSLQLAGFEDTDRLLEVAATLCERGHSNVVSYSPKVFLPLTHLCRDVCHYCTFARTPRRLSQPYMSVDQVLEQCHRAEAMGCREALFTLGEKPELRYRVAREALAELGCSSTLDYVARVAEQVLQQTGLLPHINAGCMSEEEIDGLRKVSASMGIMLESVSERLGEPGMPHHGSPDKEPKLRLQTIERAGRAAVPFTSGILIGIGETRRERIESLLALRDLHQRYGHIQEIIIQNFRAKPGTRMAKAAEPGLQDLLWTLAVARIVFGPGMNIQVPPNLSPGVLPRLLAAGSNDWGGVSPLTPDYVNPEAPWPQLELLRRETAAAGKYLQQRLTVYPSYVLEAERWLDPALHTRVMQMTDAQGFPRTDRWHPGALEPPPAAIVNDLHGAGSGSPVSADVLATTERCRQGLTPSEAEIARLFRARGADFSWVCQQADALRREVCGDAVSFVVNRNINYTNVCYFKCQFCAFSKGKYSENLRGRPYDLDLQEIARRSVEAWERGATEVCMQGGIHPEYTGRTYLDIVATVKRVTPDMHIHAFSPLEVWQGAQTMGLSLRQYLAELQAAGLGTLPGTAAEILDDSVRATLCPDKINTRQWLEVMEAAHEVGFKTTATIMFGHMERVEHWARHLLRIRELQAVTGGFTEMVPLPFVYREAPLYLKGRARQGPTFAEVILMHAVARLVLHGCIDNIQASWVKMGERGIAAALRAGVNDLGGTLMNESITRAAGAEHGQEWPPAFMTRLIGGLGRQPRQRNTVYGEVSEERQRSGLRAQPLSTPINTPAGKKYAKKTPARKLVRNPVIARAG